MEKVNYSLLTSQLASLLAGEKHPITNMAQFSAFVFNELDALNWAGFYLADSDNALHLGPFQGQVACTRIAAGKGVCGTAFAENRILRVADVHQFAGHIACDSRSQSEIVLPFGNETSPIGVFDVDSPVLDRFDEEDEAGLLSLVDVFVQATEFEAFSF